MDRLSSLPPELLFHIFELAHNPFKPLNEPLSRTLLPYYRHNLYRQIQLSTVDSFYSLVDSVIATPSLRTLVHDLDIFRIFHHPSSVDFYDIIGTFPSLKSVKTGYVSSLRYVRQDVVFPPIEQLSYECGYPATEDLETLTRLKLRSLEIDFHRPVKLDNYSPSSMPKLETVKDLTLFCLVKEESDDSIWTSGFARFVTDCNPNITSLRLVSLFDPDYRDFLSHLAHHAPQITSLSLDYIGFVDHLDNFSCDHLLPQFINLAYLSLGAGTTGNSLFHYIRRLPRLASLRLTSEAHRPLEPEDFLSLVQGPTRLVSLKRLILDCFGGEQGRRTRLEDQITPSVFFTMMRDGWSRSSPGNFSVECLEELTEACEGNGVAFEGEGPTVVEYNANFNLEEANRSVLRCLQLKSLDDVKLGDGSPRFRHIPVDGLDPQNLKLVKVEIPEKNWFRLSLE
ncbi:hypothetical protein JCM5353_005197 [Sporobolomyces roseus]